MSTQRVAISEYEWFQVAFDETGEPSDVTHCRIVWSSGGRPAVSKTMSERVRRAIDSAKQQRKEDFGENHA
jgi:hypothetical protein